MEMRSIEQYQRDLKVPTNWINVNRTGDAKYDISQAAHRHSPDHQIQHTV